MEQFFSEIDISTNWVENLALEELNMDESGVVNFNNHLDPNHFLEESSIRYMDALRDRFEFYATKFNEYRGNINGQNQIKIFKISNTINDFMLYRNSLRLVIARKSNDLVSVGFISSSGSLFAPRINNNEKSLNNTPHEIRAHLGPFNDISWRFQGETINTDAMVRHYLSEFIQSSAR
jgi:hypothetical protein